MNVTCHVCGQETPGTARCCTACGAILVRECQAAHHAATWFCMGCGQVLTTGPGSVDPGASVAALTVESPQVPKDATPLAPWTRPAAVALLPAGVEPMEFVFDPPPPPPPWPAKVAPPGRTSWASYVGGVLAFLVLTVAVVWYTLVRPGDVHDAVLPAPSASTPPWCRR